MTDRFETMAALFRPNCPNAKLLIADYPPTVG